MPLSCCLYKNVDQCCFKNIFYWVTTYPDLISLAWFDLLWVLIIYKRALKLKTKTFRTAPNPLVLYLLPSDQEEVYSCQVDAEFLTQAQQQVPDGHAGPQRH